MDELLELIIEIIIELIAALIDDGSKNKRSKKYTSSKNNFYTKSHSSSYYDSITSPFGHSTIKNGYVNQHQTPPYSASSTSVDKTFKKQVSAINNNNVRTEILEADKHLYNDPKPIIKKTDVPKKEYEQIIVQENRSKEIRFGTVMLRYIFFQDDLKLSFKEVNLIKKYFRKNSKYLEKSDLIAIKNLLKITPDMDAITTFYAQNNLNQKQFNRVYSSIHKIVSDNSKYNFSLGSIKTTFMEDGVF